MNNSLIEQGRFPEMAGPRTVVGILLLESRNDQSLESQTTERDDEKVLEYILAT